MADKRVNAKFRYRVEMVYLDIAKGKSADITNECVKYLIIDHNYDVNSMPIIYAEMNLDRALVDDMILNVNKNLMLVAIYKFDELTDSQEPVEVIRDRFTYFLPSDVNKNAELDYNETTIDELQHNTFRTVTLGLMSIRLINHNKRIIELNVTNNNIYACAKYCLAEHENLVIEPFIFSEPYDRIIVPPQQSVNAALKYLNSFKVFYYTPYRFYQDFNYTYLISSSGVGVPKPNELYNNTVINIRDELTSDANDEGIVLNKTAKTYEIPVNYVNAQVYDNSIGNKSRNKLLGITSSGGKEKTLLSKAEYSAGDKFLITRINNDNADMIYNIKARLDDSNVFVYFGKNDLDMDALTINKRITVHHIDRYQEHNGDYLLSRKRELLLRDNTSFVMFSMVNLRKIENDLGIENIPTALTH